MSRRIEQMSVYVYVTVCMYVLECVYVYVYVYDWAHQGSHRHLLKELVTFGLGHIRVGSGHVPDALSRLSICNESKSILRHFKRLVVMKLGQ